MKNTPTASPHPLDDIVAFMRRFVAFTDDAHATVLALWVCHTWAFDSAYATPYIYVTSAEKQSGKTRLMEVLHSLSRNGQIASSVTGPALFKQIEGDQFDEDYAGKPTLFIDEVDTIFTGSANEMLRSVLNSGYKRNGYALRADGKYSTFCPKLLAGIDNAAMPDTIADRCIRIVLKRKRAGEEVERWHWRKVEADAETLLERIAEWAKDNALALHECEPDVLEDISDRAFEISEPLLAIAQVAGKDWLKRAQDALRSLLKREEAALSIQAQVLAAARAIFENNPGADRVFSASLAEAVGVSQKRLGVILQPYGITPKTIRYAGDIQKGYYKPEFTDAWERYL